MPVDEKTIKALDLTSLPLPPSPAISRIEVEEYIDSTGEPSLRLLVVLAEQTDVASLTGKEVGALKAAIHQSLLDHGVERFPYIFLVTPEELAEPDEP